MKRSGKKKTDSEGREILLPTGADGRPETIPFCEALIGIARKGDLSQVTQLPGMKSFQNVIAILNYNNTELFRYFYALPEKDKVHLAKAIAVLEDSVGTLGSVTMLRQLLPLMTDKRDTLLDWVLKNTRSYEYFSNGARNIKEFRRNEQQRHENAVAQRQKELQQAEESRKRKAEHASKMLAGAVRRNDQKAIKSLLEQGADPGVLRIKVQDVHLGEVRHEKLPEELIKRIRAFKKILSEVETIPIDLTIKNFQRDMHPEREIAIWERIASTYKIYMENNPSKNTQFKKEVYDVILGASFGEEEFSDLKILTQEQVRHIILNYREG